MKGCGIHPSLRVFGFADPIITTPAQAVKCWGGGATFDNAPFLG
jgi:hypothetical protein